MAGLNSRAGFTNAVLRGELVFRGELMLRKVYGGEITVLTGNKR